MSMGPYFRSPLTDLTGSLINHQQYSECGNFEMRMMDCMEAYGIPRAKDKCQDLIADFQECSSRKKQILRVIAMRDERHRQYAAGERKEKYATAPKEDSY